MGVATGLKENLLDFVVVGATNIKLPLLDSRRF